MLDKELCFLAIIPPEEILDYLWGLKHQVAQEYLSKAALRSPPHITIHMPFKIPLKKKSRLVKELTNFSIQQPTFSLSLSGFGSFPPKVIYVKVEENQQLSTLQQELGKLMASKLSIYNANYRSKPFHPHITIGFRDLKKDMFLKAWDFYSVKTYHTEFEVNQIALLIHDGKKWHHQQSFKLS